MRNINEARRVSGEPNLKLERAASIFAWFCWGILLAAIVHLVARAPLVRSDSLVYRGAAEQWWNGRGLYEHNNGIDGFLYFPQYAILYSPFAALGTPVGDILWRVVGLALLTVGLWRAAKVVSPQRQDFVFALATLAALAPSIASLRNGQANLHIAGLMLNAAVEIFYRRWNWAAFWIVIGLIAKPIMVPMALLCAAVYRPMIWRVALGLVVVALMPFAFQRPGYVMEQYRTCLHVLSITSNPWPLYCNARGLLGKMGWTMSPQIFNWVTYAAAGITLALCLLARKLDEPLRIFLVWGLCACYLVDFNPRTEANSYVILAPVIAIQAAALVVLLKRPKASLVMYFLCFLLFCDGWAYKRTENWLKPLTGLIYCGMLVAFLIRACGYRMSKLSTSQLPAGADMVRN